VKGAPDAPGIVWGVGDRDVGVRANLIRNTPDLWKQVYKKYAGKVIYAKIESNEEQRRAILEDIAALNASVMEFSLG
jgi:hypothetical protein